MARELELSEVSFMHMTDSWQTGVIGLNTPTLILPVAVWASSRHGAWVTITSVLWEPGRRCIFLYDLASEVTSCHFGPHYKPVRIQRVTTETPLLKREECRNHKEDISRKCSLPHLCSMSKAARHAMSWLSMFFPWPVPWSGCFTIFYRMCD